MWKLFVKSEMSTGCLSRNVDMIDYKPKIQLTEKRYAAMMKLMQAKKSNTIEQPPIPQTIKSLPRFIFLTYPWYWIKNMYRSKHFRLFLVICMACALAFLCSWRYSWLMIMRSWALVCHIYALKDNDTEMMENEATWPKGRTKSQVVKAVPIHFTNRLYFVS